MSLRATVLPIIRHCATLVRGISAPVVDEQIEVECRMRLDTHTFYALFSMLAAAKPDVVTPLGAVQQRDAIYRVPQAARRRDESWHEKRSRVCYHPTLNEPLFAVEKLRMLAAERTIITLANDIFLRVDAQKEVFSDPNTVLEAAREAKLVNWRAKDRRSFVLRQAPHWQIDMTRVVEYADRFGADDGSVLYELEFELSQRALRTAEPGEMMTQLEHVVKFVLGV